MEQRIYGFDLLRGLCAIAVAAYHMLSWAGTSHPYSWGLFAVYIFFVLSGASMVVAYRDRFAQGFPAWRFLLLRFARLAPLFVLAVALNLRGRTEFASGLLNASFLFGLGNPGATSWVVGGWSLGIEFAFYLMFPVLLSVATTKARYPVAVALAVGQLLFVHLVLGGGDLSTAWPTYTQPLAFIAYFYIGCVIGESVLNGRAARISTVPFIVCLALILLGSGSTATDTLTGLRGTALFALSVLAAFFAGGLALKRGWQSVASFLGDASYGVYLLHPFAYAIVAKLKFPPAAGMPAALLLSVLGAHLALRLYENPIRRWAKHRLAAQVGN